MVNIVTVDFLSEGQTYLANDIQIMYRLNDMSTVNISLVPKTAKEKESLSSFSENIFKEASLGIYVNGRSLLDFTGICKGFQPSSTSSTMNLRLSFVGGLYRLMQMSAGAMGFRHIDPGSSEKGLSMSYFKNTIQDKFRYLTGDIIDRFKTTLSLIYEFIVDKVANIPPDYGYRFTEKSVAAIQTLYKFHANKNLDFISKEFSKIVKIGLTAEAASLLPTQVSSEILHSICSNENMTFWNILAYFCEKYQLCIGEHNNKSYIFPNSPADLPSMEIDSSDISSIDISPLPFTIPTRIYLNTEGLGQITRGKGLKVPPTSFPKLEDASVPTKLEEKLNTIRILCYSDPGISLALQSLYSNMDATTDTIKKERDFLDNLAKAYLVKETFKFRNGSLTTRFMPDIPVGTIIKFKDPFFNKTYQGYITGIIHTINSSFTNTTFSVQYVIEDIEKQLLGFDTYMQGNPLYPSYSNKELKEKLQ